VAQSIWIRSQKHDHRGLRQRPTCCWGGSL
jgi:hypothetical protein